jgi:4'-phosphopantetheinyl transferase
MRQMGPMDRDVDIWIANVEAIALPRVLPLDEGEERRAERFVNPAHGHRFRVAHWMRRMVLGKLLGLAPEAISYVEVARGKPSLAVGQAGQTEGGTAPAPVTFSASDSGRWVALAVTCGADIGLDIEVGESVPEIRALADRVLHPGELALFRAVDDRDEERDLFYRFWTRKEAIAKACGLGLALDFRALEVEAGTEGGSVISLPAELRGAGDWTIRDVSRRPQFYGSVAVRGPIGRVTIREWAP